MVANQSPAQVIAYTWTGNSTNNGLISDGQNWGGTAPTGVGGFENLIFGASGPQTNVLVTAGSYASLYFDTTRPTYTFSGSGVTPVLTISAANGVTVTAGATVTFSSSLGLNLASGVLAGDDHNFNIAAATTLQINSAVSGTGHLSKVGSGTLVLTGVNTLNYDNEAGFNNGIAVNGGTLELKGGSITQSFNDIIVGSVSGGTGTLLVSNGGDVTTKYGVAGNDVSTNATITVTGAGSTWTNSQGMALGYLGTGFLNVLDGGTVNTTGSGSDHSYLGLQSGTAGTAVVSGTGSSWTTPNDQLIIGGGGTGHLTISAGGLVSNTSGHVGLTSGGSGTIVVDNGTWTNSAQLYVGYQGIGSLSVTNGGAVTNTFADVGAVAGSTGFVDVTGAGSTWTSSSYLMLGNGGMASLLVSGGGTVSNTVGTLGNVGTGHGEAVVTGAGSLWTNTEYLYVGAAGFGLLEIQSGGDVTSVSTSIGNNVGGEGAVTVTGAGSSLTNSSTLYVGSEGLGYLEISGGATVLNVTGSVGNNAGGSGDVYMDTGGTWTNTGSLIVGNADNGDVSVYGGSTLTAANATLGSFSAVYGAISLNNSGSLFSTSGNLVVGGSGDGELDIGSGADAVTGGQASLGNAAGGYGWGFVDGAGSTWSVAGNLTVGNSGSGEIHLTDSALLGVNGGGGTITLGANVGASGQLRLGVFNGEGGSNAGVLNAALITTGSGLGKVYLEPYGATDVAPFYLTKDGTAGGTPVVIAGPTLVEHNFGYTVLNGANSYSGGTTINAGTLVAAHNTALGTGSVVINGGTLALGNGVSFGNLIGFGVNGGKLAGEGTFTSPLTLGSGVKLAPGSSPGTMTFGSDLTLNDGGSLEIEIRAPSGTPGTDWDFVSIAGTFNLSGLTAGGYSLKVISLDLANNPGAVSGLTGPASWVIATAGGGITGFQATDFAIDASQFFGGGNFTLSQAANDLVLSFTPVPEPSTYALMISGLALAGLQWRRRRNRA